MYSVGELVIVKKYKGFNTSERSYGIVLCKIEGHYLDTYNILCNNKIVSIIDHFIEKI